jgi:hypothetical protein
MANIAVGIATVEEVDATVHATPNPNASVGSGSFAMTRLIKHLRIPPKISLPERRRILH